MTIYFILFFVLAVAFNILSHNRPRALGSSRRTNGFIIFSAICFILLIGLRGESVGSDTKQYAVRYQLTMARLDEGFDNPEILFDFLQFICIEYLGLGYHGFLFLIALFSISVLFYAIHRYSVDELTSVFLLFILAFSMYLSGIRQCTAISFCIMGFIFAESGKKKSIIPYILCMIAAYFIHNSSIFCLPVYFLWRVRINRTQAWLIFIVVVSALIYRPMLTPVIEYFAPAKYEKMEFNMDYDINPLVLIISIFMALFTLLFIPTETNEKGKAMLSKQHSFFYVFLCLYLFLQIMSISNDQLWRLSYYFMLGFLVNVPAALHNTKYFSTENTNVIRLIICLLCVLHFAISSPGNVMQIDNYKFFWE